MTAPDLFDEHLTKTFDDAQHDPRWAAAEWADPLTRIRAGARTGRRRTAAVSALAVGVAGAGLVTGLHALDAGSDQVRVVQPADGGAGTASDGTGLRWLLPLDEYRSYAAATPRPSDDVTIGPSPVPINAELRGLQADLRAALPDGYTVLRSDAADGGAEGHAVIELRLADGTPLVAMRQKLDYPLSLADYTGPGTPDPGFSYEHATDPTLWPDDSAYSVVTGTAEGYSLLQSEGGDSWSGPQVDAASPDGWLTVVTAPVDEDTLVGWAKAIDAHFSAAG